MDLTHIAYCGVDCSLCPEYLSGKCPDCRQTGYMWYTGSEPIPEAFLKCLR